MKQLDKENKKVNEDIINLITARTWPKVSVSNVQFFHT